MWTEVIKFVGGSAILLAITGWLIRTTTQHFLTKDIEQYKDEIQRKRDMELEELRAALNIETVTHEVKFLKLHNRRAEIIEELFKKLVVFEDAASCFMVEVDMHDIKELQIKANEFIDIYFDFQEYFKKNEIYFSKKLCGLISGLYSDVFNQSILGYYNTESSDSEGFKASFNKVKSNILSRNEQIKSQIINEFRELIGNID